MVASVAHAVLVMTSPGFWEGIFGTATPFMREDTADPNFSTVEIVRMTSTKIELGLPKTGGTVNTDSVEPEGAVSAVVSRWRATVDLDAEDDEKHRLATQTSDVSLGKLKMAKYFTNHGPQVPSINSRATCTRYLTTRTEFGLLSVLRFFLVLRRPPSRDDCPAEPGQSDHVEGRRSHKHIVPGCRFFSDSLLS